ncbi:hypothetical protein A2630_00955 [Candidatus Woesebacteria bacterium RIFCSPHIGHO2_01_FULL_44_10]|uniref:Uncharacterized protein n=1 Tax=Candidatus Woesebacteria bacterium RIFCSPLOWO2_01_FULL_44_14 TaxID=1802525 RepID=A0A1F8C1H3_9BACT|nr:MAG: hypothetical protein A2630_00955 [Candidatus Woesebacteria bacterium RIFCSPHIGHO2_01_FULL_44_10]OGM54112.1 MAG: hypothetical protein A3F62_05400 [Candidatus Woesebacteria bacterium RIFCSPHIGHO2_12_FULL_44_11]OGM70211.1 MAG: hypothetical protein A2975_04020 [Candidatus Woesebacteria bacterium RIFCSPLOWO2_01_FULL_44_14]
MRKRYHRKLIRDKIPEFIEAAGDKFETRILKNDEFRKELMKKLVEEAKEVAKAPSESLLDELADVLEMIKSISSHFGVDFKKVEKHQTEKRKKRGGFQKKLFLVWSTEK